MNVGSKPTNRQHKAGDPLNSTSGVLRTCVENFGQRFIGLMDRPIPEELSADPERARRARLITRFGVLGSLFGLTYATFYLLIGHKWGCVIILICSLCVATMPM